MTRLIGSEGSPVPMTANGSPFKHIRIVCLEFASNCSDMRQGPNQNQQALLTNTPIPLACNRLACQINPLDNMTLTSCFSRKLNAGIGRSIAPACATCNITHILEH